MAQSIRKERLRNVRFVCTKHARDQFVLRYRKKLTNYILLQLAKAVVGGMASQKRRDDGSTTYFAEVGGFEYVFVCSSDLNQVVKFITFLPLRLSSTKRVPELVLSPAQF